MTERTIFDVANWFLHKESMTPKKLQKLVYYACAWAQALLNRDLTDDCDFEAWVHGPVNRKLYAKYKDYGWTNIPYNIEDTSSKFTSEELDLLESVWLTYGDKTANELEAITHDEWPWIEARGGCLSSETCTRVISKETMQKFYRSIYEQNQGE